MSVHVLLILLNELGKKQPMQIGKKQPMQIGHPDPLEEI